MLPLACACIGRFALHGVTVVGFMRRPLDLQPLQFYVVEYTSFLNGYQPIGLNTTIARTPLARSSPREIANLQAYPIVSLAVSIPLLGRKLSTLPASCALRSGLENKTAFSTPLYF
jgi:hypothetical protein